MCEFARRLSLSIALIATFLATPCLAEADGHGTVLTEQLTSEALRENRIGLDTRRSIKVYLPPGYDRSTRAYPVVYYLHNFWWSAEQLFSENNVVALLDRAFASGAAKEFIFVAADFSTPTTGSLYENSPISGRWLDFITEELVPFVDRRFRTLARSESRGIAGDFFGGRGALRVAMLYPEIFGVVYALHPVATGIGNLPWSHVQIDWRKLHAAKSFADLEGDGRAQIFVTVSQAFLPNPNRPPFYCDFFMEPQNGENGEPKLHLENTQTLQRGFLLDQRLREYAPNLRKLRAIALEWGRYDPTHAHVESNEAFSRQLDDLGIEHEAEEFRGGVWDRTWTDDGRFYTRVVPFLDRHLAFEVLPAQLR